MKKTIMTIGVLTAITPMLNADMAFADNIGTESIESRTIVDSVARMSSTGKVVGVKSNDYLNIRVQPSASAKIVGKMKNGATMSILGRASNGWYKVNYNGVEGYSSNKYISTNVETNGSQPTPMSSKGKINVASGNLNIRKSPTTSSSVIGKLRGGTIVDILSKESNGWYYINASGQKGYVYGEYVTLVNGSSSSNQSGSTTNTNNIGKIATVKASALNIRSGAGTNYSVINKVYSGNTVKILDASNGWYKVSLTSGATGWCSGDYLGNFRDGSLPSNNTGNTGNSGTSNSQSQSQKVQAIINVAKSKLGSPYVWGAEGPNSFDCSGFTSYAFRNGAGVTLPRVSRDQAKVGQYVSKANLQPGDLVFFDNNFGSNINHVGIYLGNNEMIHCPKPGDVVKITKINNNYYNNAYVTARRVVK